MRSGMMVGAVGTVVALLAGTAVEAASFDEVADFYRGKQLRLIIGFDSGGSYDVYARTVARHMEKYIPGNPHVIAQNMPGAGTRKAANYLATIAPRDGSVIGTIAQGAPMDELMKQEGVQFESAKFGWIGNPIVDNNVTIVRSDTGLVTLEDALEKGGLICGGTTVTTPSITFPRILNNMLGANIKIVPGYTTTGASFALAMERGETNCSGGNSWEGNKLAFVRSFEERRINVLVQWGPEKNAEVSAYARREVPLIVDYAKTDADRSVLGLVNSGVALGRPLFTPPAVPPERLAALRAAFDRTMSDPAFLFEMQKFKLAVRPLAGERLQRIVEDVIASPEAVIRRANELMAQ